MNYYIGNPLQIRGAEHYVLRDGKGDGMNFLCIRNGIGLECWVSIDRGGDLSRVSFKGDNMGYFSPCGYVSPKYYDGIGAGFLKSFTAGFFTTCGLTAVGTPCSDDGEELPLHGTFSNTPATVTSINETENVLKIALKIRDCVIFGRKIVMERVYTLSYSENTVSICDTVTNEADKVSPYMILYHCNMGYPLLDETSIVRIPNTKITPRNEHAKKYILSAMNMEKPQSGFEECCYYYDVKEDGGKSIVGIFSDKISKGVSIVFNKQELPCFTEWKMMGKYDYVLGLEPGNCIPDGRDVLRENGTLQFLEPEESKTTNLCFEFFDNKDSFEENF